MRNGGRKEHAQVLLGRSSTNRRSASWIGSEKRCQHMNCISEGSQTYDTWGYSGQLPMCTCPMRSEWSWTRSRRNVCWSATHVNRRAISVITPGPNKFKWAEMSYSTNPRRGTCLLLQPLKSPLRSLKTRSARLNASRQRKHWISKKRVHYHSQWVG